MKISARNFLFKEGDKIENLYIVRSGSLNALRKEFKRIKIIESFLPGSIIGEIPSTENEKHLYSVRAEEDSEIEIIPIHLIHSVLFYKLFLTFYFSYSLIFPSFLKLIDFSSN